MSTPLKITISIISILILFELYLNLSSFILKNSNEISDSYFVEKIENYEGNRVENCLKTVLVSFNNKDNTTNFPGYKYPSDKGYYYLRRDSLRIKSLKDCYFNGDYKIIKYKEQRIDYLILQNNRLEILLRKIDFIHSGIKGSVFENLLDTIRLNSDSCRQFRNDICTQ